jgi:dienelactone hydrolase
MSVALSIAPVVHPRAPVRSQLGALTCLGTLLLLGACGEQQGEYIMESPATSFGPNGPGVLADAGIPTTPLGGSDASLTPVLSPGSAPLSPWLDAGTSPARASDASVSTAGSSADATAGESSAPSSATPGGSCLNGITNYGEAGPFKFEAKTSGAIKFWVPSVPAGCKVPVIHLANGTGASCAAYGNVLQRFASHGFLAACYESAQTGAGTQGVEAFTKALEMFPDLADMRLGSTGHSQGGQAAFTVLQQSEAKWGDKAIYAGLSMEPASGFGAQPAGGSWQSMYAKIKSPMFMFSGTADTLVSESWVSSGFAALDDSIEAYWWSANGATHIPTPQAPTMQVGIPWFRWKLLGDKAACEAFKALPATDAWDERKSQHPAACN